MYIYEKQITPLTFQLHKVMNYASIHIAHLA